LTLRQTSGTVTHEISISTEARTEPDRIVAENADQDSQFNIVTGGYQ